MAWRVARSLDRLLAQLDDAAPRRDKASDGSIGDAAHAARTSDHNPWVKIGPVGIVTARDYTHDLANDMDCERLAQALAASGDRRIKYVIWNRRIWQANTGWKPYGGSNPHTKHLHLSVSSSPALFEDSRDWAVPGGSGSGSPLVDGSDQIRRDQIDLTDTGFPCVVDGIWGEESSEQARNFQAAAGLVVDGIVGPATRAALGKVPSWKGHSVSDGGYPDLRWQQELKVHGWRIETDGMWGPHSASILGQFQEERGLIRRDGVRDSQAWTALFCVLN